nr:vegetative cell wall protein gp1-like [Aegilops tauschii subsp. strangulata]
MHPLPRNPSRSTHFLPIPTPPLAPRTPLSPFPAWIGAEGPDPFATLPPPGASGHPLAGACLPDSPRMAPAPPRPELDRDRPRCAPTTVPRRPVPLDAIVHDGAIASPRRTASSTPPRLSIDRLHRALPSPLATSQAPTSPSPPARRAPTLRLPLTSPPPRCRRQTAPPRLSIVGRRLILALPLPVHPKPPRAHCPLPTASR